MSTANVRTSRLFLTACLVLALGTLVLYWPVTHDSFINYDDNGYITENPHVNSGLSASNIAWVFTHVYQGYWIPLTWISMMLDWQLFGSNAGGHHFVSVLFHIANTLLLFLWLRQLTGALWRSAFVAALFAWHPFHVESVVWAAERKDVLSGLFWMLALIAYTQYVKARASSNSRAATIDYLLALFLFACGLMSKPMVVTMPFVLLLLDFWPFERFAIQKKKFSLQNSGMLFLEKVPFLVLAVAGSSIAFLTQTQGGAVSGDTLSFRLTNALGAYLRYLLKFFWPTHLAAFYPFPHHGEVALAIVAALVLVICSLAFIMLYRQRPYLLVGWFWFLGTLVPVIGIVQVGSASLADHFTYLPSIGLFILVTWAFADMFDSTNGKKFLAVAAVACLAACMVTSSLQIRYWRNSITLFKHALAVTTDNDLACACLGQALDVAGDDIDALKYCREAVRINPDYAPGQFFLGVALWKVGDTAEALQHLDIATHAAPNDGGFQYNLGKFLLEHGMTDEAAARFQAALDDNPNFAEAHNALGKTELKEGKVKEAAGELSQAVALEPDNAPFHYDLGTVLLAASQTGHAIAEFSKAIELQPGFAQAHENLAVALVSQGKLDQAIAEFSTVVQLQTNDPEAYFNLGFACLNNHQPSQAAAQFSEELQLTPNETKAHYRLAEALEEQTDFTNAIVQYREALRLTPDFPEAKKELDEILAAHPELR